ncbi:hypothetical protein F1C16_03045 [Hymenobacter sp. NBH84]|uniref:hypothetical protein n=1 Tax=Hymenobacter sp. NBH84 TaxID=2596915 RepID=UPI00162A929F|nr:hypothetical protein [Hymenobacter sp. NBH84]QNE38600.1 hypothetical protein F1C16_03045 [Hymenobacter sp. NBH84]
MAYTRSASAQRLIDAAHTKLLCYYHDGNTRTWWGRSALPDNRRAANPYAIELKRHQRYVKKEAASIKVAIIYDKRTGHELHRFSKGNWA